MRYHVVVIIKIHRTIPICLGKVALVKRAVNNLLMCVFIYLMKHYKTAHIFHHECGILFGIKCIHKTIVKKGLSFEILWMFFTAINVYVCLSYVNTRVLLWHDNTLDTSQMKAHGVDFVTLHLTALLLIA